MFASSRFICEYLNPVVKADQCAQYVGNNGTARFVDSCSLNRETYQARRHYQACRQHTRPAIIATDFTRNIRAVFKCIRQAGLKLRIEKFHFEVRQDELLGRKISPEGISLQARKNFLDKLRVPSQKRPYSDTGASRVFAESKFPGWLKNVIGSAICLKRKCQSTTLQI